MNNGCYRRYIRLNSERATSASRRLTYERLRPRLLKCLDEWKREHDDAKHRERIHCRIASTVKAMSLQSPEMHDLWRKVPKQGRLVILTPSVPNTSASLILAHWRAPDPFTQRLVQDTLEEPMKMLSVELLHKVLDFAFYRVDGSFRSQGKAKPIPLTKVLFLVSCPRPHGQLPLWMPLELADCPPLGWQYQAGEHPIDPLYDLADSLIDVIPHHWRRVDHVFLGDDDAWV